MTNATSGQLPKKAIDAMVYVEMNSIPPWGVKFVNTPKGPLDTYESLDLKASQKPV
jgi:hypothetical protein